MHRWYEIAYSSSLRNRGDLGAGVERGRAGHRGRVALVAIATLAVVAATAGLFAVMPDARAATEVHLTAAGDYGARTTTASVLQKVADLDPAAHLAIGDLAYGDAIPEGAWCKYVNALVGEGFPFELISGNHESLDEADGLINNYSACLPNQVPGVVGTYGREYFMDFPRGAPLVRVIQASPMLTFEDGKWTYAQGDAHYNWLSNAIDDGRAEGAQWIIVTSHIPCLSVGVYNCPSATAFYQLLAAKKVDLVLHGHEHAYMRTHQLRAGVSGCTTIPSGTFNAACVADNDNAYVAGQGSVFATVGTGGTPLRDVQANDSEAGYFAAFQGLNANPTFGLLDLSITDTQLTARFLPTAGGNFSDSFTITKGAPPANQPPVAAFTTQVRDRTVTVDGSTSTDVDGTIASYEWDYGDGATATGRTPPAHVYATAGTYRVTLTVRDDQGAVNSTSKSVAVADPVPSSKLAEDQFNRTVASGWGTADLGGPWTVSAASAFSVNGTQGVITSNAGSGRNAYLRSVSGTGSDVLVTMSSNKLASGSGMYVSAVGRAVTGAGDYRSVVRFMADGRVSVRLGRVAANGTEVALRPETVVPGLVYAPSEMIQVRIQVAGTNPTTVRTKVWKVGSSEPAGWTLTTTDATAALQATGVTGIVTYLSSSATNAPIVLAVDSYLVTQP
jgi:PKD repeat protein